MFVGPRPSQKKKTLLLYCCNPVDELKGNKKKSNKTLNDIDIPIYYYYLLTLMVCFHRIPTHSFEEKKITIKT